MSESMSDTKAMAAIGVLSRDQAQAIVERAARDGHGLRTLLHEVIQSRLFTHK